MNRRILVVSAAVHDLTENWKEPTEIEKEYLIWASEQLAALIGAAPRKRATLTADDVRDIRFQLAHRLMSQSDLAARYRVTRQLISQIKHRQIWKWVE